jgi:hypothetical protein
MVTVKGAKVNALAEALAAALASLAFAGTGAQRFLYV